MKNSQINKDALFEWVDDNHEIQYSMQIGKCDKSFSIDLDRYFIVRHNKQIVYRTKDVDLAIEKYNAI